MIQEYVPRQGDVVLIHPAPAAKGHKQAKGRPWRVISSKLYQTKVGLMLAVPLTTALQDYPFEVPIEGTRDVSGAALADQVQCMDWRARNARRIAQVRPQVVADVGARIAVLVKVRTGG